jgi:hypothetical protein
MHINKSHRAPTMRVAWISVGLAAAMGVGCPVCAEPIMGLSGAPSSAGAVDASPWSAPVETPAMHGGDDEGRTSKATGAVSQQDVRSGERPWRPVQTAQTGRSLLPGHTEIMAAGSNDDDEWRREIASTVLDAVRPAYDGLVSSGILDAVRSVESELGLGKGPSFNDVLSGDGAENTGQGARPESVSWAGAANRADTFSRPRSGVQMAEDERTATMLMQQLIDEVKPWILALVGLYVLGYTVKLVLDYNQWKIVRRRQRTAMGARRKRQKHKTPMT